VILDAPALTNMTFAVLAMNGSAQWVGDVAGKEAQDIMWGGYYYKTTWPWGTVTRVDNRVGNGSGQGDRAMVGPKYATWDYTLYQQGWAQNQNWVEVTVPAGQTTSNSFFVRAWKETITVALNADTTPGWQENGENFSLVVQGSAYCSKTVTINDASSYNTISPIVIDLEGNGIATSAGSANSPKFDLAGNGQAVASGWTRDALLAVDANHNGKIDSGAELFGGERGAGFAKLASYDSNHDGAVNASDARFNELSVWVDANQNRRTDRGELRSLARAGVRSIAVANSWNGTTVNGNVIGEVGSATLRGGRTTTIADVYFGTH
jgi:hypothetical protein